MSNWTHVLGAIRIDDLKIYDNAPDFENLIGKEIHFGDPLSLWDEAYENPDQFLPIGSEGTLKKSVWINPDADSIAAYTVTIFGDLRDYDSTDEIINWFKKKCKEIDERYIIRMAVIEVRNGLNGPISYVYS